MDQYVIKFETGFLFWDMVSLRELITQYGDDDLKDYLPVIEKHINEVYPNFKFTDDE